MCLWEPFDLVRKLVLIGFVTMIPESRAFVRVVVAILVCVFYLVMLLEAKPFKATDNNMLAIVSQLLLVCVFLGAALVKLFDDIASSDQQGAAAAARLMGFDSAVTIVVMILAFSFIVLCSSLAIIVNQWAFEGHVATVRFRADGSVPELTLEHDQKWHIFLSHVCSWFKIVECALQRELEREAFTCLCFVNRCGRQARTRQQSSSVSFSASCRV